MNPSDSSTVDGQSAGSASSDSVSSIRRAFADRFVPLALRGLPRMLLPSGDLFCFQAFAGSGPEEQRLEGTSERYTAMSVLGIIRQAELGRVCDVPLDALVDRLDSWAHGDLDLGDAGLVLWIHVLRGDSRAEQLAQRMVARRDDLFAPGYGSSMELGCLVAGLSSAVGAGLGGESLQVLLADAAQRLDDNRCAETGLFSFGRKVFRKNLHRARVDARLGSFASQVYPTIGLSMMARATGDETARARARQCADQIVRLQGEHGEWWWVYHAYKAAPAVRYPVYTVHQDAMGPMMLAAAALADGNTDRYDAAIARSLRWFDHRGDLPDAELEDAERGVVWRAVQFDDPRITERLGLSPKEIWRMGRTAWLGSIDERNVGPHGYVCPECRPYHLGWILLADALFEELVTSR